MPSCLIVPAPLSRHWYPAAQLVRTSPWRNPGNSVLTAPVVPPSSGKGEPDNSGPSLFVWQPANGWWLFKEVSCKRHGKGASCTSVTACMRRSTWCAGAWWRTYRRDSPLYRHNIAPENCNQIVLLVRESRRFGSCRIGSLALAAGVQDHYTAHRAYSDAAWGYLCTSWTVFVRKPHRKAAL